MTDHTSWPAHPGRRAARILLLASAITMTAAATLPFTARAAVSPVSPAALYVNPVRGSGSATGTATAPLRTIQQAMNEARPGIVVHLAAGSYHENVATRVDGLPSARITIEGPATGTATLFGTVHAMAIKNSYYTLENFSIDGQQAIEARHPVSTWPATAAAVVTFKSSVASIAVNDRLIYIDSGSATTAVTGTTIDHMILTGAGGECVRIRNNATQNVIENSIIRYCGMYPVPQSGAFTYHNGEGVYIGTSPKSTKSVNYQDDQSSGNLLIDDTITTWGTECLDIKENAHSNSMYTTQCADNTEPTRYQGSSIELRGYGNTIEDGSILNSAGYGLKIASDTAAEDIGDNTVISDTFSGISGSALYDKSKAAPGETCGNSVASGSKPGDFGKISGWKSACPA